MRTIKAYKLFRLRKDGTLGSLFIDRKVVIQPKKWLKAKSVKTPGFAFRPGWHACSTPTAPHLSTKGRIWKEVLLRGTTEHIRPVAQGGLWYTATSMYVKP